MNQFNNGKVLQSIEHARLTRIEVAEALGITVQSLRNKLITQNEFTVSELCKIATITKTNVKKYFE